MKSKGELVQALIAHQRTTWKAEDAPLLQTFSEEQLEHLVTEAEARTEDSVGVVTTLQTATAYGEVLTSVPLVTLEAIQGLLKTELDARDQALNAKLAAYSQQASEQGERAQLAAALAAQGFTEKECAAMPLETLRKVARTVAPVTFAGMGLPAFPVQEDEDLPTDAVNWA